MAGPKLNCASIGTLCEVTKYYVQHAVQVAVMYHTCPVRQYSLVMSGKRQSKHQQNFQACLLSLIQLSLRLEG